MTTSTNIDLTSIVREKYGEAARRVLSGEGVPADCCGKSGCCSGAAAPSCDPITSNLYAKGETDELPSAAVLASLGCGNPTALAQLHEGDVVLDLGSGGGIDVILSARRVGPTGKAYGLDMTDDMLALARRNAAEANVTNVEFLRGQIESIPLPDDSVDVIISNCVINLSGDKKKVLAEAFRVLKPGGRFAVSDVVVRGETPPEVRKNMELWIGCVAGALEEQEFIGLLEAVGFANPTIEPTRVYQAEDAAAFLASSGLDVEKIASEIDGKFMSSFVRATKPATTLNRQLTFRRATVGDLPGIESLLVASNLTTAGVTDSLSGFVVAEHDGALAGVAGVEECGEYGLLRSVVVVPSWRNQGLGRQLVARMIAASEAKGLKELYLLTMDAAAYYPSFGFTTTTRDGVPESVLATAQFQGGCLSSATVMVMPLASGS